MILKGKCVRVFASWDIRDTIGEIKTVKKKKLRPSKVFPMLLGCHLRQLTLTSVFRNKSIDICADLFHNSEVIMLWREK
jgi:hypothetical protein